MPRSRQKARTNWASAADSSPPQAVVQVGGLQVG